MNSKYNLKVVEDSKTIIYEFTCEERISFEISRLNTMSDAEICQKWRVDSRQEAIKGIYEYWREIH